MYHKNIHFIITTFFIIPLLLLILCITCSENSYATSANVPDIAKYYYVKQFGVGMFNGEGIVDTATDSSGNLYVIDSPTYNSCVTNGCDYTYPKGSKLYKFDYNGNLKFSIGDINGVDPTKQFRRLAAVAVDSSNNIYLLDSSDHLDASGVLTRVNCVVKKFDQSGTYIKDLNIHCGSSLGQLSSYKIGGMSIDTGGNIYITDGPSIKVWGPDANYFIKSFDGSGIQGTILKYATGVAVDYQGYIVVSDFYNNMVEIFAAQGGRYVYPPTGSQPGNNPANGNIENPVDVALETQNSINNDYYIADLGYSRIDRFHLSGAGVYTFVSTFGSLGNDTTQFNGIDRISVYNIGDVDYIYVVDNSNGYNANTIKMWRSNYCGDGMPSSDEQCDYGGGNTNTACTPSYGGSCSYCDKSCIYHTIQGGYCGDGIPNGNEQCDNGPGNTNTACTPSYGGSCSYCTIGTCLSKTVIGPYCGDGIINGNEQCDNGLLNGPPPANCSTTCKASKTFSYNYTIPTIDPACYNALLTNTTAALWNRTPAITNSVSINFFDKSINGILLNGPIGQCAIINNVNSSSLVDSIVSPGIGQTFLTGSNVQFKCYALDGSGLSSVELWVGQGTSTPTKYGVQALSGTSYTATFTQSFTTTGSYTWYCKFIDTIGNSAITYNPDIVGSYGSFNIVSPPLPTKDIVKPIVYSFNPGVGSILANGINTISCSGSDNAGLQTVDLYLTTPNAPSQIVGTQTVSGTTATANFPISMSAPGLYVWNCKFTDTSGNSDWTYAYGTSNSPSFTVSQYNFNFGVISNGIAYQCGIEDNYCPNTCGNNICTTHNITDNDCIGKTLMKCGISTGNVPACTPRPLDPPPSKVCTFATSCVYGNETNISGGPNVNVNTSCYTDGTNITNLQGKIIQCNGNVSGIVSDVWCAQGLVWDPTLPGACVTPVAHSPCNTQCPIAVNITDTSWINSHYDTVVKDYLNNPNCTTNDSITGRIIKTCGPYAGWYWANITNYYKPLDVDIVSAIDTSDKSAGTVITGSAAG